MWTIIRHDLQKVRTLIAFGLIIFFYLFFHISVPSEIIQAETELALRPLLIILIYTGIMFLGVYFTEQRQGTLFLLLGSPLSRTRIYWAKILSVLLLVLVLLLLLIMISAYKSFGWENFLQPSFLLSLCMAFYLNVANAFFWGSLFAVLSLFMRSVFIRWLNVLIVIYASGASSSLFFRMAGMPNVFSDTLLSKVLYIIFYQRLIFLSDHKYLYAALFLSASFAIFWAGSQIFVRRSFYAV